MNLDKANTFLNNESSCFEKLKSFFTKIYNAENAMSLKRINNFGALYAIEEKDNEGLKDIYSTIREKMKNFEEKRKTHFDYIQNLLIKITQFYPNDFKEQKRKLEDLAKNRKLLGAPPVVSGQQRPLYEKNAEKDFGKFIVNEAKDKNNLIKHFIYSELKYHSEMLENLSELFFEINDIEPLEYFEKFGKDYVGEYDYKKLGINMKEIKSKKKAKKAKKKQKKDEIYEEEEDEENENEDKSNSSFKGSKKKSDIKNSSIKKSSKEGMIKPADDDTEIEKPNDNE